MSKLRVGPLVLPLCLVPLLEGCAGNAPVALALGHVGEPGSLFALSAEEFARRANARLDDYEVVVFGSSQLGSDELVLQKLRLGTVDFGLPSTVLSSQIDEFALFEMPYLVRDRAHMKAIERDVVWPELAPLAEEVGYRIVAVWENGYRHVTNNVRPVETPADLAGIKLRTPRGIWRVRLFQSLGANPTPMPLSEVSAGLRAGVIDGQENPLAQIWASKLQEVQAHLTLTRHVYTPAYLVISPVRWESLPEDVRAVLEEEARATGSFVHETAARLDRELLERLRATDIEIVEPELAEFREAATAIRRLFARDVASGEELLRKAEQAGGFRTEPDTLLGPG